MGWFGNYISNVGSTIRNYAGGAARIGIALLTLATPKLADASPIPWNTYLDPPEERITQVLRNYDSVGLTDFFDRMEGLITWKDTGEPVSNDYRLWVISMNDWQPVGCYKIGIPGYFVTRITGDDTTPFSDPETDEGARVGNALIPVIQDIGSNRFFWGEWTGETPVFHDWRGSPTVYTDIRATTNEIPEPATLGLVALGGAAMAISAANRRRNRPV